MITVEEIQARVAKIADSFDDETQHGEEDELHQDVLRAIAEGATNAAELAVEALKTCDLEFSRWYA